MGCVQRTGKSRRPKDRRHSLSRYVNVTRRGLLPLLLLFSTPHLAPGYSVLTHQQIVDTVWSRELRSLILMRFPGATPDQLKEAHAYAYGGAIIQDMGYYPFGSHFFSDLAHYVRSGDFVVTLLRDSQDLDEYAFALGALAHYAADNDGHPIAVNRVVPLLYPKLRAKYGPVVTYEDNPAAHLKTEFGFDVIEVAHAQFAPEAYHDFIGFKVSKPLLERAFADIYSIPLTDVYHDLDLALGTYRRTVSSIIPEMTKAAWALKKKDISQQRPGITKRQFVYNLRRAGYEKEWGKDYEKPGPGARIIAFFFRIVPRFGPFDALAFKAPTPQGELLFEASFNQTLTRYRQLMDEVRAGHLTLVDQNFDIGRPTRQGEYRMADAAYAKLLEKLGDQKQPVPESLRANLIEFYRVIPPKISKKARAELEALRTAVSAKAEEIR